MAIQLRQHTDISDGALASQTSGLKNDAKIAYMLFTGIVKDKVGYVIREVAKNAWEVSPPDRPFELDLPGRWSPKVRIRDFGPGLSHHFMMNRYSVLGDSTKDGNGVGGVSGWGLGSKSPLAYLMEDGLSGSYTVISYRDGNAAHYIISLSEGGMPVVKHFMDAPTTEPNGLEVSFAVREDDFEAFRETAEEILWSFEPRPVIAPAIDFGTPKVMAKGDNWTSFDPSTVPFSGPQVRVGPVMYPIDMQEIPSAIGFVQPNDCIIFDADPDAVSPTASREQLQYTSGTKKGLIATIKAYEEGFAKELQTKIDAASCYFEGCDVFHKETQHLGVQRYSSLRPLVSWGGQPLRTGIDAKVKHLHPGWSSFDRFRDEGVNPASVAKAKVVVEHSPYASLDRFIALDLVGQDILWARVKRDELPGFLEMCALKPDDVTILDTAPIAKRAGNQVGTRFNQVRRRRIVTLKPPVTGNYDNLFTETVDTIDLSEGGLVLTKVSGWSTRRKDNFDIGKGFKTLREGEMNDLIRELHALGLLTNPIRVMRDTGVDDVTGDEWESLGSYIEAKLTPLIDLTKLTPVSHRPSRQDITHNARVFAQESFTVTPPDVKAFQEHYQRVNDDLAKIEERIETPNDKAFRTLMKIKPGIDFPVAPAVASPVPDLMREYEDLMRKYPLYRVISTHVYNRYDRDKHLGHYFHIMMNQK